MAFLAALPALMGAGGTAAAGAGAAGAAGAGAGAAGAAGAGAGAAGAGAGGAGMLGGLSKAMPMFNALGGAAGGGGSSSPQIPDPLAAQRIGAQAALGKSGSTPFYSGDK